MTALFSAPSLFNFIDLYCEKGVSHFSVSIEVEFPLAHLIIRELPL